MVSQLMVQILSLVRLQRERVRILAFFKSAKHATSENVPRSDAGLSGLEAAKVLKPGARYNELPALVDTTISESRVVIGLEVPGLQGLHHMEQQRPRAATQLTAAHGWLSACTLTSPECQS